jgi:hypothetical protein
MGNESVPRAGASVCAGAAPTPALDGGCRVNSQDPPVCSVVGEINGNWLQMRSLSHHFAVFTSAAMVVSHDQLMHRHSEWFVRQPRRRSSVSCRKTRAVASLGGSEREPLAWPTRSEFNQSGRLAGSSGHPRSWTPSGSRSGKAHRRVPQAQDVEERPRTADRQRVECDPQRLHVWPPATRSRWPTASFPSAI